MKQLTQEVFDLFDCPEWAESAAIDGNGEAWFYACDKSKLKIEKSFGVYGHYPNIQTSDLSFIGSGYDTTNWENSAINRALKPVDKS